jgi:hypothetical protein
VQSKDEAVADAEAGAAPTVLVTRPSVPAKVKTTKKVARLCFNLLKTAIFVTSR